jgi:predicted O-methyltransferase YrrM
MDARGARALEESRRNTLWSGQVADPGAKDQDTLALKALNDALVRDERVDLALLTVGDGLTLALKR